MLMVVYGACSHTLEHPGVKAPGTAKRTPFLLANTSAMFTLSLGLPSNNVTDGSLSPTWKRTNCIFNLKKSIFILQKNQFDTQDVPYKANRVYYQRV